MYHNNTFYHPVSNDPLILKEGGFFHDDDLIGVVKNYIPRFVLHSGYSESFGLQWQKFRSTQLDSYSGVGISASRLMRCIGKPLESLNDKRVLEAGCGAGRFTEVLLNSGAYVDAFDLSDAVNANYLNNGHRQRLVLAQADILHMPFKRSSYDLVICLGVLQHTPIPEKSIELLWSMVCPGGWLVIDHYHFNWRIAAPWPLGEVLPIYRFLLRGVSGSERLERVRRWVDFWFPLYWRFRDSKILLKLLRRLSPLVFHYPDIHLPSKRHYYEWSLLDTHDGTTDFYKHRRSEDDVRGVLETLPDVGSMETFVRGNGVEARCQKV